MWVQKIPEFHSGHILKQEMMVELSAYLYHLGPFYTKTVQMES